MISFSRAEKTLHITNFHNLNVEYNTISWDINCYYLYVKINVCMYVSECMYVYVSDNFYFYQYFRLKSDQINEHN